MQDNRRRQQQRPQAIKERHHETLKTTGRASLVVSLQGLS